MTPHHTYEAITLFAAAIASSGAAAVVSHPTAESLTAAVLWSVLPLIGAILISGMSFLLGSVNEPRKRVFGRALGAVLVGVAGPRFALYYKPALSDVIEDPILLIAAGALCGLIGYAVSAMVINWVMVKAPGRLESKLNELLYENEDNKDKHE